MPEALQSLLACRAGGRACALPLEHVIETMRPLPIEPIADAPSFVRGVAIIRGGPVPVVDCAALIAGTATPATRFVLARVGDRRVALAVDDVLGVVSLPRARLGELPPLLRDAAGEAIAAVGTLDARLLLVLETGRLLPELPA